MRRKQPGFFDIEERAKKLTQMGDPLIALNAQVDREAFRADLNRVHHGVGVDGCRITAPAPSLQTPNYLARSGFRTM